MRPDARQAMGDARSTIRVAWHWDEESRIVVIGYVGQHQRTRAT